jgi:hypothetical protein
MRLISEGASPWCLTAPQPIASSCRYATKNCPGGRPDLVRQYGGADRWVEATLRAPVELGYVLREAVPRIGVLGVHSPHLHAHRGQQPLDLAHRPNQLFSLARTQRREQRSREFIGALVERSSLAATGGGEARDSNPPVVFTGGHLDQTGDLE